MGNTHSTTTRRHAAPRAVKTRKSPRRFGLPSQKRAHAAAPVAVKPRRKFGFGSSRKHRHGAAPVATTTVPSNSMTLRKLKAKISPGPKVANTNKRSRKNAKKDPVSGIVNKLAPTVGATGASAAPRHRSRGFGFGRRRPVEPPITTKRGMFSRFQRARAY
ncbi:hypothetical protein MAM1_0188d07581 [Mucor ambiguus]|uniref:Uncharacterized protein n=1 Tax=Mucor ambiguus TaxID=91626 RepID=A0A0C9MKJ9_9FUNG|nr:hypothetical protein MAM1_0188d07581 [Mucor ambiguus]